MRITLSRLLDLLRTGFWFLPTLMLLAASGLALLLLYADERLDPGIHATLAWAYSGGPEGARSLLSTIAGSMITAASVTFSLASVALSIASQQYGSRVLRNFMRDRVTQLLLGVFVATFIYSVLVVRAIRGSDVSGGFVPAISVTGAIALSLISLVLLIYFVHHVSASIQASHIVEVIAKTTEEAIPRLYPSQIGQPMPNPTGVEDLRRRPSASLAIAKSGYLQTVDAAKLLEVATERDLVIELLVKPGDHLLAGSAIARLWGSTELEGESTEKILSAFFLDYERNPAQDIRYQFQQLTDVIIRALSPGINDPFTAISGIDQLASTTLLLARRSRAVEQRQDDDGVLRLIVPTVSVIEVLQNSVSHIAIYAAPDRFVMEALRKVLGAVAPELRDPAEQTEMSRMAYELDKLQRKETAA